MAEWVKEYYIPDYILSRTLRRASKTAEILGNSTKVKVEHFDELMEFNNGLLAGLPFD